MTMNSQRIDIIGQGWSFPMKLNSQGGISLTGRADEIRQSIEVILNTSRGERRMRPEFGSLLHEYVFAQNNATTWGLLSYHVQEALARWEPRIEVDSINVAPDENDQSRVMIEIKYTEKATNDERNLVVPFYLRPMEE